MFNLELIEISNTISFSYHHFPNRLNHYCSKRSKTIPNYLFLSANKYGIRVFIV